MYDIKIVGGRVLDLENDQWLEVDIGVKDGVIQKIGSIEEEAKEVIDARGFVVSPGFIDIHLHEEDYNVTKHKEFDISLTELQMGVTTACVGNCGNNRQAFIETKEYIKAHGNPINFLSYVGHNSLRVAVGNNSNYEESTQEQIEEMRGLLNQGIEDGAIGISLGLEYCQGTSGNEVLGVMKDIFGRKDLLVSAHYRHDGPQSTESVIEMASIAKETGIPFQLSHMVSCSAFGNAKRDLALLEQFRNDGIDILADTYPYNAFSARIGTSVYDDGCFERWNKTYEDILLTDTPYEKVRATKEIFEDARKNYPDMIAVAQVMEEEDSKLIMQHPLVMIGSDGGYTRHKGHPRGAGTFPRFLGKYVREEKLMGFFTAMHKITTMPAKRLRLDDRKGYIKEGYDADLVIFDEKTIIDQATFFDEQKPPIGISHVILNGGIALKGQDVLREDLGTFYDNPS